MKFCTAINCMDGRVQLPVNSYLRDRFNVDYVDSITEPGPNLILARQDPKALVQSILARVKISIENHSSVAMAIVGHHNCSGNPNSREEQRQHLLDAVKFLRQQYAGIPIIALWVDETWKVNEISND